MTEPAELDEVRQRPALSWAAEGDPKLVDGEFASVAQLLAEVRSLRASNERLRLGLREVRQLLPRAPSGSW